MLALLTIANLATVEALEIEFGSGLNAITGETGTGKSVILGAVQTVLGERAEKNLIRHGAERCEITARFELDGNPLLPQVELQLAEAGVPACEEGALLLRRIVTPASSRCYINSSPVALRIMRDLGDLLVDIHGPNDHQSLLKGACQLALLDTFADHDSTLAAAKAAWEALKAAEKQLHNLEADTLSPAETDFLRHQLKEIDQADLDPEEEEQIRERHRLASHSRQLIELAGGTASILSECDGCVVDALAGPVRKLQEMAELGGEAAADFADRLDTVVENLAELGRDLTGFAESMDLDAEEFSRLEERLGTIHDLKRKYRGTIPEILARADSLRERLAVADNRESALEQARTHVDDCRKSHQLICHKLSDRRKKKARALAEAISSKLSALGFASNRFQVNVSETTPGPQGNNAVDFLFAPNPGQDLMPLRKIASSGEIARVMLAVKTVLAAADPVPLLIFDEVDANVGGRIADSVAAELSAVANEHQVLCITHLPQIAAPAHLHFQVGKEVSGETTLTSMKLLTPAGRVDELVRMMGGTDSKAAREHAKEMLA